MPRKNEKVSVAAKREALEHFPWHFRSTTFFGAFNPRGLGTFLGAGKG